MHDPEPDHEHDLNDDVGEPDEISVDEQLVLIWWKTHDDHA
jgi:hypothetical protein